MREINRTGRCYSCGKKLPADARSDMLYCRGGNCRVKAHHKRHGGRGVQWECVCQWCGKRFTTSGYARSYCPGNACKQAMYRKRKAAGKQLMF